MAVLNLGFKGISFFKKIFFSDIPGYSLNTLHTLTVRHCFFPAIAFGFVKVNLVGKGIFVVGCVDRGHV